MVQTLKKVFSAFVTLTTIAWSVGVGALVLPTAASAATLSAGDLIKASGPAVYYYAADGKRYVFPNEKTYFSWFADFSSVKTITDGELAAVSIGGNVTIRPGTNLVKITTDPKTYAVTKCGTLHWIESEAVAKALYGDAWATRVVDVADGFFVNYTVGSSISSNVHPDGTLVQYAGDSSWYVVWGGMKRKIASDAAYMANGLNKAFGMTTTLTYGNGADVTGRESDLADAVCAGSVTPVSGGLTISLASDTPAGMTVPKNSSSVALTKVNLMAGGADVTVSSLQFHRVGVGAVGDFSNVYLYDVNGMRLTTGRTINSTTNVVQFNNLNLKVMAGQTVSVVVYGDFSTPGSTGGQHAFELADAASVVVTGSATISGSFPVRGNVFTVGTTSAARVDVLKGSMPANPTVGAKDVEISNFKLTASTNDVDVKQITLYQGGTVTNSNLSNFKLYQGSTVVATASAVDNNGHITLKFAPAYMISNGSTKVFSLHADVSGRSALTVRTYVEYTTDVLASDRVYNAGAQVCVGTSTSGCASSSASFDGAYSNYVEVTTQGGQLTNAFNGPATSNIAKGQLAVPLYKFTLSSPDSALDVKKMVFTIAKTTGGSCKVVGSASTRYFRSIKVVNTDTGVTVMGPQETSTTADSTSETLTFTDVMSLTAGQSANLALVADLYNGSDDVSGEFSGAGNCGYKASMAAFGSTDVRVVDTGEFLSTSKIVPNAAVTGNEMTVKTSGLDISLAANPVTGTIVKKQTNADVAGIVLSAAAQSDITITSLTLTGQAKVGLSSCASLDGSVAACYSNFATLVTSLSLWDGAVQVGQAKSPDTTTGAAQISNMNLVIPKGTSKTLTVKASLSSSVTNTTTAAGYDQVAVGINATSDVQAQDQDANTVSPTLSTGLQNQADTTASPSVKQSILYAGTITVQADAHPASAIVMAGKSGWVPLARYKATAQYEAATIERIAVTSTSGGDNSNFLAVAIAQGGAVKAQDTLPSGITGTKDIDLSASPITVPKDGSVNFEVWAQLANVQSSSSVSGATTGVARSGHQPGIGLNSSLTSGEWDSNYSSKLNMKVTGAASGERLYAATGASAGNSMVLRKSQPVVTKQSLSSTTLANVDQDLLKFQIAADNNGSIAWKQVILQYSKTSNVSLSNFRLRRGSSDVTLADYAVTADKGFAGNSTGDVEAGTLPAASTTGYIVVSMTNEESISGSGNIYTLHATVAGAASGESVTLSFYRDTTNTVATGYLSSSVAVTGIASSANIFHIDTASAVSGGAGATGTFVWSDNSEIPHSSAIQTSRDWTNDVYVQDLSQSQSLTL